MILQDFIKPAIDSMVGQMEGEFRAALDEVIPGWCFLDVKNRCVLQRVVGSPVETLLIDGKAVLEIYPLEFSEPEINLGAYRVTVTRKFRRLPREVRAAPVKNPDS